MMRNLCIILFIFTSISLVAFVPSADSLLKKSPKNPIEMDSNQKFSLEEMEEPLKFKSPSPVLGSNMPTQHPEGKHFMQKAKPDSSIHYFLLIKDTEELGFPKPK